MVSNVERYTVAILVRNEFGVLNRVTSMFRRRLFNILSLTVSETESPKFSRITVLFEGEENAKRQMVSQLYKLPDVISVKEFDPAGTISRELLLVKVANNSQSRREVMDAAGAFDAHILDYSRESIVIELTGESREIDTFIDLLRDFDILEICRTGIVSLERGSSALRKVTKL